MPGLLNVLYEQLSYPKILPFVCNLSIEISLCRGILVKYVLALLGRKHAKLHVNGRAFRKKPVKARRLCDNFRRNLCQITESFAPN